MIPRPDLTTRAPAEAIATAHRLLSEEGAMMAALDAVPELVLVLNETRQIVQANQLACDTLRLPRREILGLRPGELVGCDHARGAPLGCGTGEACQTCGALFAILEAQRGVPCQRECRISRRVLQGFEALDLRVFCQPFPYRDQPYSILTATDISSEKRRDVLERIFFHDILNLAGAVQGFVSLVADQALAFEDIQDDLCLSTASLVREIHGQQTLLEAERGALELELRSLNSLDLLSEVRNTYIRHPVAIGRKLVVAGEAEQFALMTDRAILNRVLGNLAKNALEATPPGGQVTLNCHHEGPEGTFTCHNPGSMPAEVRLQVFQRSFSTKGRGRGIGTYSVKLLTEKYLHGKAVFSSTPEAGTNFWVTLPLTHLGA